MAKLIPVDIFDLVIFGGTGDLAMRKLLPALYHRHRDGQFPEGSRIIAVGRQDMGREAYLELVAEALLANLPPEEFDRAHWRIFQELVSYEVANALAPETWGGLKDSLAGFEDRTRAIYLATAPSLFGAIAQGFSANDLITDQSRIVLEKPVGHDSESAAVINNEVGRCFKENQIFRIDHYLGKETVQNLLALRFGNTLFEPVWGRGVVDHVQITVAEYLGVGDRVAFYNNTGALRDMVQNHMMQLVCLMAMEPPSNLDQDAIRDEKLKVLRALKPIGAGQVKANTVRGRYTAGAIKGKAVPGYLEELEADPGEPEDQGAETFVAIKLEIDNWRWSGVPIYLRTGKRLKQKHSEIIVQFQQVPHSIFSDLAGGLEPNRLSIRLQPDEGVKLSFMAKEPGPGGFNLKPVALDLSFEEAFGLRYPDAYERLLVEVLRGNTSLFMRRDEVEAAWAWVDGIIAGWADSGQKTENYAAGTWGPTGASVLLDRDGHAWLPED
ncbi:MAG: glucose-6-phosphate dehydrogenase [Pseudomonadota bacterium]